MSIEPDIFRQPLTGEALRRGLQTTFTFKLKDTAPAGQYTINFQLFNGSDTNPNTVRLENRLDTANFGFRIPD